MPTHSPQIQCPCQATASAQDAVAQLLLHHSELLLHHTELDMQQSPLRGTAGDKMALESCM